MSIIDLIRNEELIYFLGSRPLFSLAELRSTIKADVFADLKTRPYPGLRIEFPSQDVCLPLVNKRDETMELTDPDTGRVLFVLDGTESVGAIFRFKQNGVVIGKFNEESFPTVTGQIASIKDGVGGTVVLIKPIDKFFTLGPIKIHRQELGARLYSSHDEEIADIMKLSNWNNNVTLRLSNPKGITDEALLRCFGAAATYLASYDGNRSGGG